MAAIQLGDRKVSSTQYTDFHLYTLETKRIIQDVKDFLDGYFPTLASVELLEFEYGYATVAPDGLAYFMKTLLIEIYGRSMLKISAGAKKKSFTVSLSFDKSLQLSEEAITRLSSAAEKSGFKMELCTQSGEITLNARLYKHPYFPVYSSEIPVVMQAFKRVFFL